MRHRSIGLPVLAVLVALLLPAIAGAAPRIAFAKYEPSGKRSHIWTIPPDGSSLKRLASGSAYDMAPAWSPGRGTIAFIRFNSGDPYEGRSVLMLMRSDGSNVRRLACGGPSLTSGTHALAYSPNGRLLAGGNLATPEGEVWKWAVTVLDLRTGKSRIVYRYQSEGGIQSLSWSPNGRRLALTVEYGAGAGLFKVEVASGRLLKTHEGNYYTGSVSWRPDGRYLLCSMSLPPVRPTGPISRSRTGLGSGSSAADREIRRILPTARTTPSWCEVAGAIPAPSSGLTLTART